MSDLYVKVDDDWLSRRFYRKCSKLITKILVYFPITPNQVTIFDILLGILSAILFARGLYIFSIIAALVLQLWYIFDCVDGEVARIKNKCSYEGMYLDYVGHDLVQPFIFLGLGFGAFFSHNYIFNIDTFHNLWILLLGIFAFYFQDLREHMWCNRFEVFADKALEGKMVIEMEKRIKISNNSPNKNLFLRSNWINKLYNNVLYWILHFTVIMNIILLAAIFKLLYLVVVFYGIMLPIVWILSVYRTTKIGIEKEGKMLI